MPAQPHSTPPSGPSPAAPKPSPLLHLGYPAPHSFSHHIPWLQPPDQPSPPAPHKRIALFALLGALAAFLGLFFEHLGSSAVTPNVALPWLIPFVILLACIATMPFLALHFWEKHYHHIALALAVPVCIYYIFFLKPDLAAPANFFDQPAGRSLAHSLGDYISFIFLLGSLYVVSGGILIRVRRKATPAVNAVLLLSGALLANIFGTTGAAVLLIRPYLRINKGHIRPFHIIFFIFLVANVGGCLTPIGDPPLFLGFLRGVPFWWVFDKCWPMWLLVVFVVLALFFILDRRAHKGESREPHDPRDPGPAVSLYGGSNLLLVFAILAGLLIHDSFNTWWETLHIPLLHHLPLRELVMTAAISISLWTTPHRIHIENVFNFAPIREVAFLFVGIFATMVPALNYLSFHADDPALDKILSSPGQFYFTCGTLSSILDNAPTYITFMGTEVGKLDRDQIAFIKSVVKDPEKSRPSDVEFSRYFAQHPDHFQTASDQQAFRDDMNRVCSALIRYHGDDVRSGDLRDDQIRAGFLLGNPRREWCLIAISLGAVFFGAMTYIGNGPNFMVKSIAENAGVKCPSFFGYILFYSLPLLLPVLILVWAIFLRPHAGG